jgi:hypothetical protein
LARVAAGRLTSELFNQDAVARARDDEPAQCAAIQVKYSGDAHDRLRLQDLVEILHGFEQSRGLAAAERWEVDAYFLVTNRVADTQVDALFKSRSEAEFAEAVQRRVGAEGDPPEWLRKVLRKYSNVAAATASWGRVLARLALLPLSFQDGLDRLTAFARRHGVLSTEIEAALARLMGRLVVETAGSVPLEITGDWLRRHLTGAPDARSLSFSEAGGVLEAAHDLLAGRLRSIAGDAAFTLATRPRLVSALRDQLERFPLVFVYGDGGTGKSVLAAHYLLRETRLGPVGLSVRADEATEAFLTAAMRRLRSDRYDCELPTDPIERAAERLRAANSGSPIVLIWDLEGIDEASPHRTAELRRLLRWWLDNGPAMGVRMIASCRPLSAGRNVEESLIADWLAVDYPHLLRVGVGFIEVGDFGDDDWDEVAGMLGAPGGSPALRPGPAPYPGQGHFATPDSSPQWAGGLENSMRHPVVWGAFANMSPTERELVVSGDAGARGLLASRVIDRFLRKCVARSAHLNQGQLHAALRAVARETLARTPPHSRTGGWTAHCRGPVSDYEAAILYREAISYGLLTENEASSWRWRHPFVADWLASEGAA